MTYFKLTDALAVRQVIADEEKVMIYGVNQTAFRGSWVVIRQTGETTIWSDDDFKTYFVELPN